MSALNPELGGQSTVVSTPVVPAVSLSLMSGFRLTANGRLISFPTSCQKLLALLALRDRPVRRLFVAETLWPDSTPHRASGNLRSAIWRVRRQGINAIEANHDTLALSGAIEVDVRVAVTQADPLSGRREDCRDLDFDGSRLTGDLLPDWDDDWLLIERERIRQLRVHALERLCERLTEAGHFRRAAEAGLAAIRAEPLRESSHRALIKVHLAEGNVAEALTRYSLFKELLQAELRLEPSHRMEELVRRFRRQ